MTDSISGFRDIAKAGAHRVTTLADQGRVTVKASDETKGGRFVAWVKRLFNSASAADVRTNRDSIDHFYAVLESHYGSSIANKVATLHLKSRHIAGGNLSSRTIRRSLLHADGFRAGYKRTNYKKTEQYLDSSQFKDLVKHTLHKDLSALSKEEHHMLRRTVFKSIKRTPGHDHRELLTKTSFGMSANRF